MADSDARPRLGRVIAALVAGLLLIELGARIIVFNFAGEGFRSLALYRWSAYGLVRNNPELTSPSFKINAAGLRSMREFSRTKPPGTFRVLLLGGSVLYAGIGGAARLEAHGRVRSDQTIADYLQRELEKDPAFAGRRIEVINGAVNFNRIIESSAGYMADYVHWSPDYVVVFGAVNNFSETRRAGDFARGTTPLQVQHPWHGEFQRLVNNHGFAAMIERFWRTGGEHSAALALATKIFSQTADRLVGLSSRFALAPPSPAPARPLESEAERRQYFNLFATYADALVAATARQNTSIAFAWEPMLSDLGGIKPLSAEERTIYPAVKRTPEAAAQYDASRRLFVDYFAARNVPVFDPTDDLRSQPATVFIDYGHYTAGGNQWIAQRLYAHIGDDIRGSASLSGAGGLAVAPQAPRGDR